MILDNTGEVIINGIKTERYMLTKKYYTLLTDCYCPKVMTKIECLPRSLVHLSKCQVIISSARSNENIHNDLITDLISDNKNDLMIALQS